MFAFLRDILVQLNGEEFGLFRRVTASEWMLYVAQNDQKSTVASVNNARY